MSTPCDNSQAMDATMAGSFSWATVFASFATTLLGAVVGAIVGGFMARKAALAVVQKASQDLESQEIRRQKVECLVALSGLRFVIERSSPVRTEEYRAKLAFELNKIPILWSGDPEVLRATRELLSDSNITRLVTLLRSLGKSTTFPVSNLGDNDLTGIFNVS